MHAPAATDALTLLEAMALSYPQAADLTFESWELGFASQRMEQAVEALLATGCIELEPGVAPISGRQARLTTKGIELLRSRGIGVPRPWSERRRLHDRRVAAVARPPPGLADRRRSDRDRRHPLTA